MMIITFLVGVFLFATPGPGDSLQNFRKQLARIQLYMGPPPESHSLDTCYHYTELLKVEINKISKIVSLDLSDSAPEWLKEDINKQKKRKSIDFKKLDSLALEAGLRNCTLVFPLIFESEDFPCGQANKKRSFDENFFQFGGKNLKGNIIFGEQIKFIWGVRYRHKL